MNTEKLIKLVKIHPCLYKPNDKDYRNTCCKEKAWEIIATELGQTPDVTKSKWKNLKDGYTKYKKHQGVVGKRNTYANWIWGPHMDFLESVTRYWESKINQLDCASYNMEIHDVCSMNDSPSTANNDDVNQYLQDDSHDAMSSSSDPFLSTLKKEYCDEENKDAIAVSPLKRPYNDDNNVIAAPSMIAAPSINAASSMIAAPSMKRPCIEDSSTMAKILKYLVQQESKDGTDHLFASYADTFKKLKPRTQATIKLKLAQIFTDAELSDLDCLEVKEEVT